MSTQMAAFPGDHQSAGNLDLPPQSFRLSTIVLSGISPFVEKLGVAAATKSLPFNGLCLDGGLPFSYMNLIETKPNGTETQAKGL
jgi:hypothetical protein